MINLIWKSMANVSMANCNNVNPEGQSDCFETNLVSMTKMSLKPVAVPVGNVSNMSLLIEEQFDANQQLCPQGTYAAYSNISRMRSTINSRPVTTPNLNNPQKLYDRSFNLNLFHRFDTVETIIMAVIIRSAIQVAEKGEEKGAIAQLKAYKPFHVENAVVAQVYGVYGFPAVNPNNYYGTIIT